MTLAACLIVRDGAATIERALDSIRPHVDEVCIFDTGSTDGTLELLERIAGEPGAPLRVERAEWRDDYAWARNASFAMASSEYLAWFDDDEILEGGQHLRELLSTSPDVVYVRRVDIWWREQVLLTSRLRVVRASLGFRWESPVHELLAPSIPAKARREVADPSLVRVVHHPLQQSGRHKHRRLVEAHADTSRHLRFYLGRHLVLDDRDYERAVDVLQAVVNDPEPWQPHELNGLSEAFDLLGVCRYRLGDHVAAMDALMARDRVRKQQLNRDPFLQRCDELERAHPIASDDSLWEQYADDPRTAEPHEARAAA